MSRQGPEQPNRYFQLPSHVRIETPEDAELFTRRMDELNSLRGLNASRYENAIQRDETELDEIFSISEQEGRILADLAWIYALWQANIPIQTILKVADFKDETSRQIRTGDGQIVFNMIAKKEGM